MRPDISFCAYASIFLAFWIVLTVRATLLTDSYEHRHIHSDGFGALFALTLVLDFMFWVVLWIEFISGIRIVQAANTQNGPYHNPPFKIRDHCVVGAYTFFWNVPYIAFVWWSPNTVIVKPALYALCIGLWILFCIFHCLHHACCVRLPELTVFDSKDPPREPTIEVVV